jgi:aldehyde dehydrogenase (NAD+)
VWTENINLALDVAPKLKCGVVWVNATNLFDASAGFGGYRESGYGREGGREGMWEYVAPAVDGASPRGASARDSVIGSIDENGIGGGGGGNGAGNGVTADGASTRGAPPEHHDATDEGDDQHRAVAAGSATLPSGAARDPRVASHGALPSIDRTPKLFIGGKQARPDSGYTIAVHGPAGVLGEVGEGNRKDVRNAVAAAHAAASWAHATGHARAQILYYIAENLSARLEEFADEIDGMTGRDGTPEVEAAISRLFTYAAWADKYDGQVHNVPIRGVALAMHEPIGVMGLVAPNAYPLLGLVSVLAPAIALGNTAVVIPSETHPLSATSFYSVLETSDLPAGVVNIVTGPKDALARVLADHDDVDAVWYWGSAAGVAKVERASASNMKRTWAEAEGTRRWMDTRAGEGREFLRAATQVKNIWVPYGE